MAPKCLELPDPASDPRRAELSAPSTSATPRSQAERGLEQPGCLRSFQCQWRDLNWEHGKRCVPLMRQLRCLDPLSEPRTFCLPSRGCIAYSANSH